MKVGINASFLRKQATGIGQVTFHFLNELFRLKKENEILKNLEFVLYVEEELNFELPRGFSFKIKNPIYKRDDLVRKIWWEKHTLPKEVLKDKCDAFISLYQCPTILDKKINHIMLVHDIIPKLFPNYLDNSRKKLYQKLTDLAIQKTTKILTVSRNSKKDLIKYLAVDEKKIDVSYISVDTIFKKEIKDSESREVLEKYNISKGYIYVGGGLEVRKNVESVMRAYKLLTQDKDLAKILPDLVISGKFTKSLVPMITDVPNIIKELEISKKVKFLGFVEQKDLPALYKNAFCFVFASLYEGFGMPVLEAMSEGSVVLTAKNSSLPEVGADAVLYSDGSVEDIARKLKKIILDKELRIRLSKKAKEQSKKFTWESFALSVIDNIHKKQL